MAVEVTYKWSESQFVDGISAHEVFEVSGVTTRLAALYATGAPFGTVPRGGTSHWENPRLLAMPPTCRILTPGAFYRIEVDYSRLSGAGILSDPFQQPPVFSWSDDEATEETDQDLLGNPLLNSAGDPFDPPPQDSFSYSILTVTKYFENYPLSLAGEHRWTINSEEVQIPRADGKIPPECMLCKGIYPVEDYDERARAIKVGFVFAISDRPWDWRFLDAGERAPFRDTADNKIKLGQLFTKSGTQVTGASRLDGKGKPLFPDSVLIEKDGKTPVGADTPPGAVIVKKDNGVFLRYARKRQSDFNNLGIFL